MTQASIKINFHLIVAIVLINKSDQDSIWLLDVYTDNEAHFIRQKALMTKMTINLSKISQTACSMATTIMMIITTPSRAAVG